MRSVSITPFLSSATPTWATSPTSTSLASPSSPVWCASSRGASPSRNGWGVRSPRRSPASRGPRRRGLPRGGPSLHTDARRPRIGIDNQNDLLAWELRVKRGASRGVLGHRAIGRQWASFLMPLYRLYEAPDLLDRPLPPPLAELYDGGLAIPEGRVYAN